MFFLLWPWLRVDMVIGNNYFTNRWSHLTFLTWCNSDIFSFLSGTLCICFKLLEKNSVLLVQNLLCCYWAWWWRNPCLKIFPWFCFHLQKFLCLFNVLMSVILCFKVILHSYWFLLVALGCLPYDLCTNIFHTYRPYWRCYFPNTQAIIYVIDSSDSDRLVIAKDEFHAILEVCVQLICIFEVKWFGGSIINVNGTYRTSNHMRYYKVMETY